jgi:hypothetical protein
MKKRASKGRIIDPLSFILRDKSENNIQLSPVDGDGYDIIYKSLNKDLLAAFPDGIRIGQIKIQDAFIKLIEFIKHNEGQHNQEAASMPNEIWQYIVSKDLKSQDENQTEIISNNFTICQNLNTGAYLGKKEQYDAAIERLKKFQHESADKIVARYALAAGNGKWAGVIRESLPLFQRLHPAEARELRVVSAKMEEKQRKIVAYKKQIKKASYKTRIKNSTKKEK